MQICQEMFVLADHMSHAIVRKKNEHATSGTESEAPLKHENELLRPASECLAPSLQQQLPW